MDNADDLIAMLCIRIGTIMEDASVIALSIDTLKAVARRDALDQLETAAQQVGALVQATKALQR